MAPMVTPGALLGRAGRPGRHCLELPWPGRGDRASWAAHRAPHRSSAARSIRSRRDRRREAAEAGSHCFHTPEAGGKVSRTQLTQVGRALEQLGIGHIAAYPPQARGRCERAFRTLQDRLPKELRLGGIASVAAAIRYLREVYLPEHDARCASSAASSRPRPSSRCRPSCGARCCASRRSAGSATAIAGAGGAACCRSRPARCGRTSCARRQGCTDIRTAR